MRVRVRVLFFGILRDAAGMPSDAIDLPAGARVSDVVAHYQGRIPQLKASLASMALAVNQHYAAPETLLNDNDEVAFLPPVSGGSAAGGNGPVRCSIVRAVINAEAALSRLKRPEDGAAVVFEGVVRNETRGRKTLYLDYEAYEAMALREMETLAAQALDKFRIRDLVIVHRLGRLEIGETSVLIIVASAHRAAAFEACRWLIDTLKRTVPIWKKEYFEDGAVWADGEPFPSEIPRANPGAQGSPTPGSASK